MVPISITSLINTTALDKAITLARRSSSRILSKLLGDTAYRIAWKAGKYTPHVEMATIDSELDAAAVSPTGRRTNLTVGQAIVLARMDPNSAYNRATSNRWALQRPVLNPAQFERAYGDAGMAASVWWNMIEEHESRQRAARHSSTHFLKSGWRAVKMKIRALGFRLSGPGLVGDAGDLNKGNRLDPANLGNVISAGMDTTQPSIRIENLIGTDPSYPNLAREHNEALIAYGTPALQRAMNEQAQEMRDWNLNKDLAAELVAEWNSVPDAAPYQKGSRPSRVRSAQSASVASVVDLHTF